MAGNSVRRGTESKGRVSRPVRVQDVRSMRIISPEPVLAKILRARKPILIGEEGYEWIVAWIEDVGRVLRSRENIVYNIAMTINYVALATLAEFLSATGLKGLAKLLRGR